MILQAPKSAINLVLRAKFSEQPERSDGWESDCKNEPFFLNKFAHGG